MIVLTIGHRQAGEIRVLLTRLPEQLDVVSLLE